MANDGLAGKMNPEMKAKWVEALRSGKYKQGYGRLKRKATEPRALFEAPETFCCLGVLCDIQPPEVGKWVDRDSDLTAFALEPAAFDSYGEAAQLPRKLRTDLGVDPKAEEYLITLNDQKRATFEAIANYIEREL